MIHLIGFEEENLRNWGTLLFSNDLTVFGVVSAGDAQNIFRCEEASELGELHHGPLPAVNVYLVGGLNPSEKYESQLG